MFSSLSLVYYCLCHQPLYCCRHCHKRIAIVIFISVLLSSLSLVYCCQYFHYNHIVVLIIRIVFVIDVFVIYEINVITGNAAIVVAIAVDFAVIAIVHVVAITTIVFAFAGLVALITVETRCLISTTSFLFASFDFLLDTHCHQFTFNVVAIATLLLALLLLLLLSIYLLLILFSWFV